MLSNFIINQLSMLMHLDFFSLKFVAFEKLNNTDKHTLNTYCKLNNLSLKLYINALQITNSK